MHEHAPRGGAALTGGSDRTEYNRWHRQVQVGVFIDNQCIVAAQLQQTFAETLRDAHADLSAHLRGPRKGHQRDAPVIDKSAGEIAARIDEYLEYRRQFEPLQHAIANMLHGKRTQRGLGRGLPNRRIATDGGQECIPGPDCHGKIKGGNDAHEAQRVPLLVHAMLRAFRVHGIAVQHARLPHREIRDIDHLLHFAIALRLDLAVFHRYQASERVLESAQLLANLAHSLAALGRRHAPPGGCGRERRIHDVFVIRECCAAYLRQALSGRRVGRFNQRPTAVGAPAVAAGPDAGVEISKSQGFERLAVLHDSILDLTRVKSAGPHFDLGWRTTLASFPCRPPPP